MPQKPRPTAALAVLLLLAAAARAGDNLVPDPSFEEPMPKDRFGHVFAFSVAGRPEYKLAAPLNPTPHFHLAAGVWEDRFHKNTVLLTEALQKHGVPMTFISRVAGHDSVMWEDEFATALERAFGKGA